MNTFDYTCHKNGFNKLSNTSTKYISLLYFIYCFGIWLNLYVLAIMYVCTSNYVCENMNIKTTIKTPRLFLPCTLF